jgi:hypothetical protein
MKDEQKTVWFVNWPAWSNVIVILIFGSLGTIIGLTIFPTAPCLAYLPGLLIVAIIFIPAFLIFSVFLVGFDLQRISFVKIYGKINIDKTEIVSTAIQPPVNQSEIEKPWYATRLRRIVFRLKNGKTMEFRPIMAKVANEIKKDLARSGVVIETE